MNDSSNSSPRPTLKLKAGVKRAAPVTTTTAPIQPARKSAGKPGAHWSDEYKDRMQAEMNALSSR
jgi:hypothetical protein